MTSHDGDAPLRDPLRDKQCSTVCILQGVAAAAAVEGEEASVHFNTYTTTLVLMGGF